MINRRQSMKAATAVGIAGALAPVRPLAAVGGRPRLAGSAISADTALLDSLWSRPSPPPVTR